MTRGKNEDRETSLGVTTPKLEARLEAEPEIQKNRLSIEAYGQRASRDIEDFTLEDRRMAIKALDIVVQRQANDYQGTDTLAT